MGIYGRNRHSGWAAEGEGDPAGPGKRVRGTQEAANTVGTPSVPLKASVPVLQPIVMSCCAAHVSG